MVAVFLSLVGAFYVLAGFVALRIGLTSRLMDQAISQITMKPAPRVDILRSRGMFAIAGLTFLSGVLLIARLDVAVCAFLACTLVQAFYLFHYAPNVLDTMEAPDRKGRKQTTNAFVIYTAATAFVAWAWATGKLVAVTETDWPVLAIVAALIAGYVGYGVRIARPSGRTDD